MTNLCVDFKPTSNIPYWTHSRRDSSRPKDKTRVHWTLQPPSCALLPPRTKSSILGMQPFDWCRSMNVKAFTTTLPKWLKITALVGKADRILAMTMIDCGYLVNRIPTNKSLSNVTRPRRYFGYDAMNQTRFPVLFVRVKFVPMADRFEARPREDLPSYGPEAEVQQQYQRGCNALNGCVQ